MTSLMKMLRAPDPAPITVDLGGWELPPGWIMEAHHSFADCVVIGRLDLGWLTVDFKSRAFALAPDRPPRLGRKPSFTGKGWQRRLLDAAESYLRSIQPPNPQNSQPPSIRAC